MLKQRRLAAATVVSQVAALSFFFVRTLKRHEFREFLPFPRERQWLPGILSKEASQRRASVIAKPIVIERNVWIAARVRAFH